MQDREIYMFSFFEKKKPEMAEAHQIGVSSPAPFS